METINNHTLTLLNRESLSLSGICEVVSVSEKNLVCNLKNGNLIIFGENLKVTKLDVESGKVELSGKVDSIKYSGSKSKEKFFKKLFK